MTDSFDSRVLDASAYYSHIFPRSGLYAYGSSLSEVLQHAVFVVDPPDSSGLNDTPSPPLMVETTTDEQGRPVVSPRVQNPSVILAGNAVLWTHVPGPGSAPAYDLIEVGEDAEHPNSRVLVSGDYYGRMLSTPGVWNIRALRKQPDGNFVEAQTFMVEVSHQHPDPPEPKVVALPGEGSDSIQLPPYSPLTFEVLEGEWYLTGERGPIESPTP